MSDLSRRLRILRAATGRTPMRCFKTRGAEFCIKIEYANPTGSHKDRIAVNMIAAAVREGHLKPGDCVAEISSGNTAAAVAWAARLLGLRPLLFVEKRASEIKKLIISSMGGEIVEIGDEGLTREAAVEEAQRRGCLLLDQMSNEYNHLAHYHWTAVEILEQTDWRVDAFVMGIGTGGTVTGVGRRLREELGNTLIVGVTPRGSPLSGSQSKQPDTIEGLSSYAVPPLYQRYGSVVDRVEPVAARDALKGVASLLHETGVAAGPSTGAAFAAAVRLVEEGAIDRGSRIVIVAADSLTRYPEVMRSLVRRVTH
ncbi:MAG: pyridoxal-phosphate dependent enzyme [Crenarchaeota archaeon]|nr:pyridoxal-phosphate dependent enzyme [Thermoproteota archaeon]